MPAGLSLSHSPNRSPSHVPSNAPGHACPRPGPCHAPGNPSNELIGKQKKPNGDSAGTERGP
eukprot:10750667-Alexandrium_andersonii.AAC.1